MSNLRQDLEGFYQFASQQIVLGQCELTLEDIFAEWRSQQLSEQELRENVLAVKAALRDIEAGETGRSFEDFDREFCLRHIIRTDE